MLLFQRKNRRKQIFKIDFCYYLLSYNRTEKILFIVQNSKLDEFIYLSFPINFRLTELQFYFYTKLFAFELS